MTFCALGILFAAMTTQDAIVTLLNSASSTSPGRYAEAQNIVLRDAEAGKPLQQFVVGVTTKDERLSKRFLEASRSRIRDFAEKRNNPLAWYLLSMESNDLKLLKRAADGGNIQALNAYGTILIQAAAGSKTQTTNVQAAAVARGYDCFRQAAAKGDPNGFVNLGTCYLRGLGCPPDPVMAHECFKSAARAGHPEAMDYLSANYQLGHGVKKDPELSLAWRMKAKAVRGDAAAAEWLRTGKKAD